MSTNFALKLSTTTVVIWTFAMTNMGLAVAAANLYMSYNGFKVNSTSWFGYTQYWNVKKL